MTKVNAGAWRWPTMLLVVLTIVVGALGPGRAAARPGLLQDSAGRNPHPETGAFPRLGWQFTIDTGGQPLGSPQVVGDLVLVRATDKHLYALAASTGEQRWRVAMDPGADFSVDESRGVIYQAGPKGTISELDLATGTSCWAQVFDASTDYHAMTDPLEVGGIVYLGDSIGNNFWVRAFDANTGDPLWNVKKLQALEFHVLIDNGIVVLPVVHGDVWFFDAKTGKQLGRYKSGGNQYTSVEVADGSFFVGLAGGEVDGVEVASRKRLWTTQLPVNDPTVNAILLQTRDGRVFVEAGNNLYVLDTGDGSVLWSYQSDDLYPVVTGDTVYATTPEVAANRLDAIDLETGSLRWTAEFPGQGYVAVTGGTVFVGIGTSVYALDAATGESRWRLRITGALHSNPVAAGDALLVGGDDGNLYQFDGAAHATPSDGSNAGSDSAATEAEAMTTIQFSPAIETASFVGIWRLVVPAGADATIPAFAGSAAVYVDRGSIDVPDGIEVALNALGHETAASVEHGETARLPENSAVQIENAGADDAELLVMGIVADGEQPETGAGEAELQLLAGGTTDDHFPHGVVLGMDRWTLDAGASLLPTLSLMPDVIVVESGTLKVTTIPIAGVASAAGTSSMVSLDAGNGGFIPGGAVRLVQVDGRSAATAINLELDANYDVPSGGGGGCYPRCIGSRR
jgi:outer membrane protein assembly factor BamB